MEATLDNFKEQCQILKDSIGGTPCMDNVLKALENMTTMFDEKSGHTDEDFEKKCKVVSDFIVHFTYSSYVRDAINDLQFMFRSANGDFDK